MLKPSPYTLENLINGLDERGLLVLNVLIGQQAMKILEASKVKEVKGSGAIVLPDTFNAEDIRTLSQSTSS